jgi:glutathione S-transferase
VLHDLPIELIADPNSMEGKNPRGQIPVIDDDGFVLSEMPAILTYLAAKHRWLDVYPEDLRLRARISQYLHAHHSLTRLATMKLMAPHVLVAFGGIPTSNPLSYINDTCIEASMSNPNGLETGQTLIGQIIDFLEASYLHGQDFVAGTPEASIADLACYEEIGQLVEANLFDMQGRGTISAWLRRMRQLPHHDALHRYNQALGDIKTQPNSMERFTSAVSDAITALTDLKSVTIV